MRWLGIDADFAKIYFALRDDAKVIDCAPRFFASHFVDRDGNPMSPPKGGNQTIGKANNDGVNTTIAVIRAIESD